MNKKILNYIRDALYGGKTPKTIALNISTFETNPETKAEALSLLQAMNNNDTKAIANFEKAAEQGEIIRII